MARRHPGVLLEMGLQRVKYLCTSVHGSDSGEHFPASAMKYLEKVVRTRNGVNLSDREVREREILAAALGQMTQGTSANLSDREVRERETLAYALGQLSRGV